MDVAESAIEQIADRVAEKLLKVLVHPTAKLPDAVTIKDLKVKYPFLNVRTLADHCAQGKLKGAHKVQGEWVIPIEAAHQYILGGKSK